MMIEVECENCLTEFAVDEHGDYDDSIVTCPMCGANYQAYLKIHGNGLREIVMYFMEYLDD